MKTYKLISLFVFLTFVVQMNAQIQVTTSGFVGVGSITPVSSAALSVGGGIYMPSSLSNSYWINATSDNGVRLRMHNNGTASYIDTYPCLYFRTSSSSSGTTNTPLTITNTGIGISNTNPTCNLDINGVAHLNGSLILTSDARLKDNIKNLKTSLLSISHLRPVSYTLKSSDLSVSSKVDSKHDSIYGTMKFHGLDSISFSRTHMGFLAQEMQSIFPELVYTDNNGLLGVDYISLIPILVKSIQELTNKNLGDSLDFQSKLDVLKNKIIADSVYFDNKIKMLTTQINQCCGNTKLKSAEIISGDQSSSLHEAATLSQNSPNPFNQNTTIGYYLPSNIVNATIYIYNMQGLQIKSIPISTRGNESIIISGNELTPGMYIYSLITDGKEIDTKRMILTK